MSIVNKIKKVRVQDVIGLGMLIASYPFGKLLKIKSKDIWLITERPNDARDNGYYLFKYIRENHPQEKAYYAINTDSRDFDKIEKLGKCIQFGSFKHYIYYWAAKYNISSQIGTGEPSDRMCLNLERLGVIKNNKIFLQHGITKDIINFALYKNCRVNTFICAAKPEYEFVKKEFGYNPEAIKYLGFCRFDGLYEAKKNPNQILIMPTWRTWLDDVPNVDQIKQEEYFTTYNSLLKNKEFINFIEANDLKIIFYPHDNMQRYINLFDIESKNIIIARKENFDIQRLLKESALLITDYSSVFFDFAYMEKPVLYYQFDLKQYRENHYKEGYFNYERDGFGKVIYEERKLIDEIKYIVLNKCSVDEIYGEKIKNFFEIKDNKNCERTYLDIKDWN